MTTDQQIRDLAAAVDLLAEAFHRSEHPRCCAVEPGERDVPYRECPWATRFNGVEQLREVGRLLDGVRTEAPQ